MLPRSDTRGLQSLTSLASQPRRLDLVDPYGSGTAYPGPSRSVERLRGDKATGEVHNSYTLLTINADSHPLMTRMHKPDPKLPNEQ